MAQIICYILLTSFNFNLKTPKQDNITSSSLVGPLKGKQISDLVMDMLDGKVDLWVTTTQRTHIAGEVTPAT